MSQLSNGEKEMMNIFHHFKLVEGKGIMYQNIRAVQDKYISPPNIKKIPELINNLITQGYITYEKKQVIGFFLQRKEKIIYTGINLMKENHKAITNKLLLIIPKM